MLQIRLFEILGRDLLHNSVIICGFRFNFWGSVISCGVSVTECGERRQLKCLRKCLSEIDPF